MKSISLREEIQLLVCLLASCQVRNFLCEFAEKCFAVFDQSNSTIISHGISRCYFRGNFLLSFLLWHDLKVLVKSRGGGTFLWLALSVNVWPNYFLFHLRAKYPVFSFS